MFSRREFLMLGAYALALTPGRPYSVEHWKGEISPAFKSCDRRQNDCFSIPQRRTRPRRKAVGEI
jgi:hypothetical protein